MFCQTYHKIQANINFLNILLILFPVPRSDTYKNHYIMYLLRDSNIINSFKSCWNIEHRTFTYKITTPPIAVYRQLWALACLFYIREFSFILVPLVEPTLLYSISIFQANILSLIYVWSLTFQYKSVSN